MTPLKHGFVIKTRKNKVQKNYVKTVTTIIVAAILVSSSSITFFPPQQADANLGDEKEILIASWNLCDFAIGGITCQNRAKAGPEVENDVYVAMTNIMNGLNYANPGKQYDLIFLQELKAKTTNQNFAGLEKLGNDDYMGNLGYGHDNTQYMGNKAGANNEGYGVFFKNNINVDVEWTGNTVVRPYIEQGKNADQLVRPPMKANVTIGAGEYNFVVYNLHDDPHHVFTELELLQNKIDYKETDLLTKGNIIVLGDLNAGGTYLQGGLENTNLFKSPDWHNIFGNGVYTNLRGNAAYDKIIPNKNMDFSFVGKSGVIDFLPDMTTVYTGTTQYDYRLPIDDPNRKTPVTDHRLIWAKFTYGSIQAFDKNGNKGIFLDYVDPPNCLDPNSINAKGAGYPPNQTMKIYVTSYSDNENSRSDEHDPNSIGNFKKTTTSYQLIDVRGSPSLAQADANGDVQVVLGWSPPASGTYNLIADVNADGYFTNSIDVVDVFNKEGFEVVPCDDPPSAVMSTETVKGQKRDRDYDIDDDVPMDGTNLPTDGPPTKKLHVMPNVSSTNLHIDSISDLSGKDITSFSVSIAQDGTFVHNVIWSDPVSGAYNLILDVNDDNNYTPGVDVVDYSDQIGFIVEDDHSTHNDLVHFDDNETEREVYDADIAENIYTHGKNFPKDDSVDIYVISERLLKINNPGWSTWEDVNLTDLPELLPSATPVFPFGEKSQTISTSPDGTFFTSTWNNLSQIFDQPFIDYYGKKFNVVIDENQDGKYNPNGKDKVDTYDIGDMTEWFKKHDVLDSSANGNPAVSEYKEFLNIKLDLESPLDGTNVYDSATKIASAQYLCNEHLSIEMFEKIIKPSAQTGFILLNDVEYYAGRDLDSGRHVYDDTQFGNLRINDGQLVVLTPIDDDGVLDVEHLIIENDATLVSCKTKIMLLDAFTMAENAHATLEADEIQMKGSNTFDSTSTSCLLAESLTTASIGTAVVTAIDPEPFTKAAFAIFTLFEAGAAALSTAVCTGRIG